jgi:hypothetical protein
MKPNLDQDGFLIFYRMEVGMDGAYLYDEKNNRLANIKAFQGPHGTTYGAVNIVGNFKIRLSEEEMRRLGMETKPKAADPEGLKQAIKVFEDNQRNLIQAFVDETGFVPNFDHNYATVIGGHPRVTVKVYQLVVP